MCPVSSGRSSTPNVLMTPKSFFLLLHRQIQTVAVHFFLLFWILDGGAFKPTSTFVVHFKFLHDRSWINFRLVLLLLICTILYVFCFVSPFIVLSLCPLFDCLILHIAWCDESDGKISKLFAFFQRSFVSSCQVCMPMIAICSGCVNAHIVSIWWIVR